MSAKTATIARKSFVIVPSELLRHPKNKEYAWVFMVLAEKAGRSKVAWISNAQLLDLCKMNNHTIWRALVWLQDEGYIKKIARPGGVNHYAISVEGAFKEGWSDELTAAPDSPELPDEGEMGQIPVAPETKAQEDMELVGMAPGTQGVSLQGHRGACPERHGEHRYLSQISKTDIYIGETENSNKNSRQQQLLKKVLKALEPLPEEIRIESKVITEWLLKRKQKHKLDPEITGRSLRALEEAKRLSVLNEFCEIAAERGWNSLGFVGYADFLERLSKEKNPTCNNTTSKQTIIKPKATLH